MDTSNAGAETAPAAAPAAPARHCRNCGAIAPGAYCPGCGQETRVQLPTFREFVREAMGRLVGFDGRLWRTLGALFFRPGLLTREYLAGRRRRYIRPARLYLFASLLLFAAFRIVAELDDTAIIHFDDDKPAATAPGSVARNDGINLRIQDLPESLSPLKKRIDHFNSLPNTAKAAQVTAGVFHYGPYAMFVLLPAFALLLKLAYLGRRRRHPHRPRLYGEHLTYAAHIHAFAALAIVAALATVGVLRALIIVWIVVYPLFCLHAVYGGSWLGAIARSIAMLVAYSMLFACATVGLLAAAVLLH